MKLLFPLLSAITITFGMSLNAQNTQKANLKPINTPVEKTSPRITTSTKPLNVQPAKTSNTAVFGEGQYLNFDKKIMLMSVTGEIPNGFPKHIKGQTKPQYAEVMKLWAKNNPTKVVHLPGEGQYLELDSKIKEASVTGAIPKSFPKHKIFQTKSEYVSVMKKWAKNNPNQIKQEYKDKLFK
jgi:hypothetical protein